MRTVLTGLASVLVLLLVGGCEQPPSRARTPAPAPVAAPTGQVVAAPATAALEATRLDVAVNDADYAAERFGRVFALSRFDDLVVRVRFAGAPPLGREVALEIYAPGAGLLSVYRRVVEGRDLQIIVPVSGTEITKRQLTGDYALALTLDGVAAPLATTTLELLP